MSKSKKERTSSEQKRLDEKMEKLRLRQAEIRAERKAQGIEAPPRKKKQNAEISIVVSENQLRQALRQVRTKTSKNSKDGNVEVTLESNVE